MDADRLAPSAPTLVATLSLLNSTRPVASQRLRQRLEREGRVVIMEGAPPRVARVARALARRGFPSSINVRVSA